MAGKIIGLDRLSRKLKALPAAAREEIAKAMEQSAAEVVAMRRRLVPSARVRASINWTWGSAPAGSLALGQVSAAKDGMQITIYAGDASTMVGTKYEVQLARLLEFGTAPHINLGR